MAAEQTIRLATDVGGTFTDLVTFETDADSGTQRVRTTKADTTPGVFEEGILNAISQSDVDLAAVHHHVHGTTVVINALTERRGVTVGLITTDGFRDSLEIARGNRPDFFNLDYAKPPAFVPRYLRQEVPGRITHLGEERSPLDLSGLSDILDGFRSEGVEAIAICLLNAYANTVHEQTTADAVRTLWPEVAVVASHQITREWREYERTNTAVLSAYVQPPAERYLTRLQDALQDRGLTGPTLVMQSNCGVTSLEAASATPITITESGPASGFQAAAALGQLVGEPNVLALDIGGTTAKCSLIEDGQVRVVTDYWIERNRTSAGYPVMVPVVDLVEIGNGGGSIAWVDDFGKLRVGPHSAGALPGPASYGRGGTDATTTDANLWLGRIGQDDFCGGDVTPDLASTERALTDLGAQLGIDATGAARGIVRLANDAMLNALNLISLNRGFDPRDFTLVAFGGGGPMHAVALARELGIGKVIIPEAASVFSAWGMLMADVRRDAFRTRVLDLDDKAMPMIAETFADVCSEIDRDLVADGVSADAINHEFLARLRYQNQEHTIEVPVTESELSASDVTSIIARFHDRYEAEYTYCLDAPVEFVGVHITGRADAGKPDLIPEEHAIPGAVEPSTHRPVDFADDGVFYTPCFNGDHLRPGHEIEGPAIIEGSGTSVVVHPECTVTVDGYRNTHITLNDSDQERT